MSSVTNVQNNHPHPVAAYPAPPDAVVLAGTDRNPKRLIGGRNKAFLEIGGQVLVRRVVDALLGSSLIGHIYLVGPADKLQEVLPAGQERVHIVNESGSMLTNAWAAVRACEADHASQPGAASGNRPMLFTSCDLPLISSAAVDDFVSRCAQEDKTSGRPFSLLVGVAEEMSLKPYYPQQNKPGIIRPYVHMSSGQLRLANIYVARPHSLEHQEFLQTGFSYRKAKDWRNVVALAKSFFGQSGGWYAAWLTLRLQATLMSSRRKGWLYHKLRQGNTPEKIERACSAVLGGSVRIVTTPYGGLSLDVDEEEDYRVLNECFADWSVWKPQTH